MNPSQTAGSVEVVPYETPEILLHCSDCDAKFATYELTEAHEDSGVCRQPAETIEPGHTVVRMSHRYATRVTKGVLFRVVGLPDPKARRKADKVGYRLAPLEGGVVTIAPLEALLAASDADHRVAANTHALARLVRGAVVTANTARFGPKVIASQTRLVVLAVAQNGTVEVTLLGGMEGQSWSKIPRNLLSDPLPREEV